MTPGDGDALRGGRLECMREYVAALEEADLERMLALFNPRGRVVSPLAGALSAKAFFAQLFEATAESRVRLSAAFLGEDGASGAAHLDYDWKLANGTRTRFECVDLFRFDKQDRIQELKIFYDPGSVREDYEAAKARTGKRRQPPPSP